MDRFDRMLLNLLQLDSARTADSLARDVPLSPSAISRRLRRLHSRGLIAKSIAFLSPAVVRDRLRAIVTLQLEDHGKLESFGELRRALTQTDAIQWFYETAGSTDWVFLIDCANMAEFNDLMRDLILENSVVLRHECHFVLDEFKHRPFVDMLGQQR